MKSFKLALLFACLALILPARAQTHPRLFFGPSDVPALRAKITQSPWLEMYQVLLADAESGQYRDFDGKRSPSNPNGTVDGYGETVNAFRCAFLYVLTGDDTWAQKSRAYVEYRLADTSVDGGGLNGQGWALTNVKGLALYFHGKGVAMAYDWCYDAPSWQTPVSAGNPTPFRQHVSQRLLAQADVIATNGGTQQNTNAASNWQCNRGSAAVLCYLATDESFSTTNYNNMYNKAEAYVRENIGTHANSRGWNIEGIGYLGFPWAHLVPAAIAAKRADPLKDMLASTPGSAYTLWSQYAATVRFNRPEIAEQPVWTVHPDFGDDNATADDANGCFGFAFPFSKPELLPGIKYWYDRTLIPEQNYDYTRAGTIFSILYYPNNVTGVDPLTIPAWRDGFNDQNGNGFFTWRNQYLNSDDMVAQMYLKLRGNKGHNGPDALSFRILGLNTAWAVGGGRYGPQLNGMDVYLRSMNTLYPVHPENGSFSTNENSGSVVGTPLVLSDGSGHVISSISKNNVGTASHKRWFVSDYSRAAGVEAVYVIGDTSNDGFWWQFNTLEEAGLAITTGSNTFEITGRDGATLRGTVLFPTGNVQFEQGSRARGSKFAYARANDQTTGYGFTNKWLTARGDGDYVIVLTVAKAGQTHPAVSKSAGRVVNSQVTVGPKTYSLLPTDIGYNTAAPSLPSVPAAPGGLSAVAHPNYLQVDLSWTDNANNENGTIIERSTDGVNWTVIQKLVVAGSVLASDATVAAGTAYQYRVRAFNDGGDSASSNIASATTIAAGTSTWIADESFEGCNPGNLNGQGSGGGWKQPWTATVSGNGSTTVVDVSARPLSAAGVSGGNRAVRLPFGENVANRAFSNAQTIGAPVYISYLVRWDAGAGSGTDTAWLFNTSNYYDWRFFGVSRSAAGGDFRASCRYNDGASGGPEIAFGQTQFLVCRVTTSEMKVWVNTNDESSPPAIVFNKGWSATPPTLPTIPGLGLSSKPGTATSFVVDRIVAGWDWNTVVFGGLPPTSGPPVFDVQPSSGPYGASQLSFISPQVSGFPWPTFQWEEFTGGNWVPVSGATGREYIFTPTLADNGRQFRCVATNTHGSTTSSPVTLNVVQINNPPTISIGQTGGVNPPNLGVSGTVADSDGTIASVQVYRDEVLAGNATLAGGTWSYVFNNLATGTYTFRARATDSFGNTTDASIQLVHDSNAPPTISNIADQTITQGSATSAIAFTVGDTVTPVADLVVSATSSNTTLLPPSGIVLAGSGASRTITLTPASALSGISLVTVTVTDGGGKSSSDTFNLTVTAPPVASAARITPGVAVVPSGGSLLFSATLLDQFGQPMAGGSGWTWSATGGGSINSSGLFTAGALTPGFHTIGVTNGTFSATATVAVGEAAGGTGTGTGKLWTGANFTWSQPDADSFGSPTAAGDELWFTSQGITDGTSGKTTATISGTPTPGNVVVDSGQARYSGGPGTGGGGGFNYFFGSASAASAIQSTGGLHLRSGSAVFGTTSGSGTYTAAHSFAGALDIDGGVMLGLSGNNGSRPVTMQVASLAQPNTGETLLCNAVSGAASNSSSTLWSATGSRLIVTGSKPAVVNGMVSPAMQYFTGANELGHFLTFNGNNLIPASANYTAFSTDWSGAAPEAIVNVTAAVTLPAGGPVQVHALRVQSGNQDLGGRTVTLGSGGLMTTSQTISNGTLAFGSTHGHIGAYNGAAQTNISAAITGTGGVTFLGTSQVVNLTGANSFTGGIFVNGGAVRFKNNAANGNPVTVNPLGQLVASGDGGATGTTSIGALSGAGKVTGWPVIAGSSVGTLEITVPPATESEFTGSMLNGSMTNATSGRYLAITKLGTGTQVLSGRGSYSGPTNLAAGTLVVNGDFSAATGAFTVSGGTTLAGNGSIGGAATVNGTLSPGDDGIGRFFALGGLTWSGGRSASWSWELGTGEADLLSIVGNFSKSGGGPFVFDFGGSGAAGTYTLVEWTGSTGFNAADFSHVNLAPGLVAEFVIDGGALNLVVENEGGPQTPFEQWQDFAFPAGTPLVDREPGEDPDMDGFKNLLEYALGLDPMAHSAMPSATQVTISGQTYLEWRFNRPAGRSDVSLAGEASDNLAQWLTGPAEAVVIIQPAGPDSDQVVLRDQRPFRSVDRRLLRLRATR